MRRAPQQSTGSSSTSSRAGRQPTIAVVCSVAYVVLVATICFSLYLEVHYLSDVLAGASLGLAWAAGCVLLRELNTS
jgi:membrane-associated phospholipid phosphatase